MVPFQNNAALVQQSLHSDSVLVVDDDVDSLTLMSYILEQFLCARYCVDSSALGLAIAQEKRPTLILLDILMPDTNGYELLKQLKASPHTAYIPVIAVTALASSREQKQIMAAGFDGYLSKPYLINDVENLLACFLQRSPTDAATATSTN
jgi:CheY-like chemotaxis protein